MLLIRAERTHVAGRIVDQTMSNHFVLAFKPLPADTSRTAGNRTVVRALLGVNVGMRAEYTVSKANSNNTMSA
jgi:hypothetical protein